MNINTMENTNHYPRLFALIIGINKYQSKEYIRTLQGAVPDGKAFRDYLIKRLRVPEEQIKTLFDEQATRSAIIQAFRDLSENFRIKEGDPIFIFYAGHGSQKLPHPDWEREEINEKMEVIVPHDCTADLSDQIPAPTSVPPIPDRTIGALIDEIARRKGDNITVVFDCCHSASGTRGSGNGDSSSTLVRSAFLGDLVFDKNTDRDIWDCHSRGALAYDGYSRRGLRSHILIAACSSGEDAVEESGHGKLSTALLKLLKTVSPDKLRYCDILEKIERIPKQNPQCEGHARDRFLFNGKIVLPQNLYPITFESNISGYILDAGAAAGIGFGAEFTVYSDTDKMQRDPLGTLIVYEVMPFSAKMKPPPGSDLILGHPNPSLSALQTKPGHLADFSLYIPPNDLFYPHYLAMRESDSNLQSIILVTTPEDAHLKIRTKSPGNLLVIELTDERVTRHGDNLFTDQVKPDPQNVSWILEKAAHYHRELNRSSLEHFITDHSNRIKVEFFKLEPPKVYHFGSLETQLTCIGENLCQDNIIDLVVDEGKPYGISIFNGTDVDLYVNAFFFDNTNFAILSYYHTDRPKGPYRLEPPLKKGSSLPIGYGRSGEQPFTYPIRAGRDVDVGFLKIYLSTRAFNLSSITQGSALTSTRAAEPWHPTDEPCNTWETILIPVIQRRKPKST